MKKIYLLASVAFLVACGSQKQSKKDPIEKGLDLSAMDTSVRPQDDFYNFVNGKWAKTAQIPADKSTWGTFQILRDKTDEQCLAILDELLQKDFPKGSEGQKIKDLYASYLDWNRRNAEGLKPLGQCFVKIDAIQSLADLQRYLIEVTPQGENPICNWSVSADKKDSQMNAVYLGAFSIGLSRSYYQKDSEANTKTIAKYQEYVTKVLSMIGEENPAQKAQELVDMERRIAKLIYTNEERRDPNITYNPVSIKELSSLVKGVNLPLYLSAVGVQTDRVIVPEIRLYKAYDTFLSQENIPLLKTYLKYQQVSSNLHTLDSALDELSFDFYTRYLRGQQQQRPMNKRALGIINGLLGEAFGKLYVERYFPAKAKEEMLVLIDYLRRSFAQHIQQVQWMSPQTKEKALAKLNKFGVKVGYPDKWTDYSRLEIAPASTASYFDNVCSIRAWRYKENLADVGQKVDKSRWRMTPQTINAYYSPMNNEIVFPAAILQAPFFSFDADPAVNFGGIGAVIGHEITHGFDDSGAEYDGDGNLKNWWTPQDKENFKKVTKALAAQFDKYEVAKGVFVNGIFTNGENIADLGGVNIAYDALQLYLKEHGKVQKISGYTQEQRFFISWATVWRGFSTQKHLLNQVKTDPHTPQYIRAFAPLTNVDAWYKAFGVKKEDKLYRAPQDRVKIW
jgi:neprilysin